MLVSLVRGQASLITVVMLVSVSLVLGIALAGYASSVLAQINAERLRNSVLEREVAVTIVYEERVFGNRTYLGVIRVDGSPGLYYYLIVNGSGDCRGVKMFTYVHSSEGVEPEKVFCLDGSGSYSPLSALLGKGVKVPLKTFTVPPGGKPQLLEVVFEEGSVCKGVVFFTKFGDSYYEVTEYVRVEE